jgi:choline-sulfatase
MKPSNLLIILSDQHNPKVLGCAGHPLVKTPHLDALAARGTRFSAAYTNCPICVPARASFATGRYVHRIRCWDNAIAYEGKPASWGHRTMAAGHRTVSIGKLHYKGFEPAVNGFHEEQIALHIAEGLGDLSTLVREEMPVRTSSRKLGSRAGPGESDYNRYDRDIAGRAARWLEQEAPKYRDKPWVLYVGFVAPHPPMIVPQPYFDLYDRLDIPLPKLYARELRPDHPFIVEMRRVRPFDEGMTSAEILHRSLATYFGLVTFLDDNIGQVLGALERCGLAENTRVLYSSDHGENLGARGLWGKSTLYDESAGVPMILAGPDVPAGQVIDTPVTLADGFPTILDSVGVAPAAEDADLPGRSLLAIARGEDAGRAAFSEYHASAAITGSFMLRDRDYKYIHYVGLRPMLFDLKNDPEETRDLATDPAQAATLKRYEAKLRAVVDPEAADALARADQQALLEKVGGRAAILKRGAWSHSPAPGTQPEFYSLENNA